MSYKHKVIFHKISIHVLLGFIILMCLFPVIWMSIISIKTIGESVTGFNALKIEVPTLANYKRLFELIPIWRNLFNSAFTSIVGTITTLFFCSLAGYAFAKFDFPGRNALFYFVIGTMMISTEVGAIPLFVIMRKVGLVNSLWSLVVPRMATAIGIFYLRQYMLDVPDAILESARIDGLSEFGVFRKIVVPIAKPALASWASITMIARWNDFFWPLIFLRNTNKYTLMVSVSMLPVSDGLSTPWQVILAGTTLVILPSIILYLAMQMYQKADISAGAVKG